MRRAGRTAHDRSNAHAKRRERTWLDESTDRGFPPLPKSIAPNASSIPSRHCSALKEERKRVMSGRTHGMTDPLRPTLIVPSLSTRPRLSWRVSTDIRPALGLAGWKEGKRLGGERGGDRVCSLTNQSTNQPPVLVHAALLASADSVMRNADNEVLMRNGQFTNLQNTRRFCASCPVCVRTKSRTIAPFGLLKTLPIPSQPWESIGIDLSGMIHLVPTVQAYMAPDMAGVFFDPVHKLHDPKRIAKC
ncbi:uncharacterized protein EI90DRAFT_2613526 [Cantharellus anzutake]|uniref:uncharacterized protein n=1 Tax=Cantharellus anzutake TaxID=1750568 RepID=UPI001906F4BC|nr:uncharacterized protein EI90DRAFT_2613526 [Cantharellus anzutake]KAF8319892.1 hypothetical protein EI90DRAFT_2613526 [Cantharellus anzutake]